MNEMGGVPYTPILPLLYGLKEALNMLEEEGIENVWARHTRLATGTRKAVAAWGLAPLCKTPRWQSDSLTVVETPAGIDANLVVKNAYAKYNLSLGLGLAQVNGKVFRIGHLGNMDDIMNLSSLAGAPPTPLSPPAPPGLHRLPWPQVQSPSPSWQATVL